MPETIALIDVYPHRCMSMAHTVTQTHTKCVYGAHTRTHTDAPEHVQGLWMGPDGTDGTDHWHGHVRKVCDSPFVVVRGWPFRVKNAVNL